MTSPQTEAALKFKCGDEHGKNARQADEKMREELRQADMSKLKKLMGR